MRTSTLIVTAFSLSICSISQAQQTSSCTNADFELNNFSNWIGKTGDCCPVNTTQTGIVNGRHTIMSGPGFDPFANSLIPLVAPGGQYSVRLGNSNVGAEAEQLSYSFLVTSATALFIYRYAVVLEDPGHNAASQPRFSIRVFDQNDQPLTCGTYDVVASANIPGFISIGNIRIKPWTTIGVELSSYIGQYITIEFTTADCAIGGHFGYAYIDCFCSPFLISSDLCPGSNTITLNAPTGFTSYLWSNGDTLPSIVLNNPVIGSIYSCTMTSVSGCQVALQTVINPTRMNADFYTTMKCTNETRFIDSSFVITGTPIQQWLWDFGDGSSSTDQYPVHQYTNPGNYTVKLIVYNSNCSDTVIKNITVIPSPTSNFSFQPQCPNDPVPFINQSTFAFGTITSYLWDFGDGSPAVSIQNPSHIFNSPGPFNVKLDIEASNGCRDSKTQLMDVVLQPNAVFNYVPNCQNQEVAFTNAAASQCGPVIAYNWDFGDGSAFSNLQNPIHTYPSTGIFNVTYSVTTWNGIVGTNVVQIIVPEKPIANFNVNEACELQPTLFDDQSQIQYGTIIGWEWKFGNNDSASGSPQVQYAYNESGLYDAELKVISNFNCADSIIRQVKVREFPLSSFQADLLEGCEPLEIQFHSTSASIDGNIIGFEWDFGNAGFDSIHSPITTYNAGLYSVSLVAISEYGCRDTHVIENYITSYPLPRPNFTSTPSTINMFNPVVNFIDLTSDVISWYWDFADGATSSLKNPTHKFHSSNIYPVELKVTSSFGCINSIIKPVEIREEFTIYFPNSFTPNGDGINDEFRGLGMNIASYELYIFNRWGEPVFSANNYDTSWDGTDRLGNISEGLYSWRAEITDGYGKIHNQTGTLALIK